MNYDALTFKTLLILIPALPLGGCAASRPCWDLGYCAIEAIGPRFWPWCYLARPVLCCFIRCIRQVADCSRTKDAKTALGYEKIVTLWSWAQSDGPILGLRRQTPVQLNRRAGVIFTLISFCVPIRLRPSCWPSSRLYRCWLPFIRLVTCTATGATGDFSATLRCSSSR